jgi:hypothetical protein
MQCNAAIPSFHDDSTTMAVVGAAGTQFETSPHAVDGLLGNAVVQHVHHAADGGAAIQQRRRAAHHLDPLHDQRVDRGGVVWAQGGGIRHADAVLQDADTVFIHATDNRTAGIRSEVT